MTGGRGRVTCAKVIETRKMWSVCPCMCVRVCADEISSQKINLRKREEFLFKQHTKRFTEAAKRKDF